MKKWIERTMGVGLLLTATSAACSAEIPVPPQDQGLPYTRSARPAAREAIGKNIALFPGSRYAYVAGYRTRLMFTSPNSTSMFCHGGQTARCRPLSDVSEAPG